MATTATTTSANNTGGGISSFLQNGQIPEGSAYTATTRETTQPQWYQNYAQQLIANQNALMQQPYQVYQGPRTAAFNQTQQQGFDQTTNAAQSFQPGLNAATGYLSGAMGGPGAYDVSKGALTGAATATNNAMSMPGALDAAQPWMQRAGATSVADINSYMNPYTEQVVNRIGELGARNLSENLMPAITSKYINAGQLGFGSRSGGGTPSGMMTDTARAVRDVNADILAQQSSALQQGYTQAANLAQGDLSRYQGIGSTMGNLGQGQQQIALSGAGQLADIAAQRGQLANTQQQTGLDAAGRQADLAGLQQKYGLEGANAMLNIGNQQQGQVQKNLDVAYGDFLRQQGWSQEQINNALNTLKGVQGAVPTAQTEQGLVPSGREAQYAPSDFNTAIGAIGTGASIIKDLIGP